MKKFQKFIILLEVVLLVGIGVESLYSGAASSTVTYSTRKLLGDGITYTFTWVNATATEIAHVMGTSGTGFLVTNMNDKGITVELSSGETHSDQINWSMTAMGNHEATADTLAYDTLRTTICYNKKTAHFKFSADTLGNYPYIIFRFQGLSGNATTQSMTARIFFDYDNKYVGGN